MAFVFVFLKHDLSYTALNKPDVSVELTDEKYQIASEIQGTILHPQIGSKWGL